MSGSGVLKTIFEGITIAVKQEKNNTGSCCLCQPSRTEWLVPLDNHPADVKKENQFYWLLFSGKGTKVLLDLLFIEK